MKDTHDHVNPGVLGGSSAPACNCGGPRLLESIDSQSSAHANEEGNASRTVFSARFGAGFVSTIEAIAEGSGYAKRIRISRSCFVMAHMTIQQIVR